MLGPVVGFSNHFPVKNSETGVWLGVVVSSEKPVVGTEEIRELISCL